jgi:flagellar protein FlaJ
VGIGDLFKGSFSKKGKEEEIPQIQTPAAKEAGIPAGKEQGTWTATKTGWSEPKKDEPKSRFSLFKREKKASVDLGPSEIREFEKEQQEIEKKLEHYHATQTGIGRLMRHPLKIILEKPINILIICVPVALFVFIFGTALMIRDYGISVLFNSTVVDDVIVFSILIVILPVAILDFRETQRVRHLEEALPNFFRDLAGMNDSGMTLPNAIHLVSQSEYSTLTPYIRRMDNEMSWNTTFIDAINRFRQRLGTPLTDRSIDLIAKASRAGGDVSEVLRAAAKDTYEFVQLQSERRNNMLIYVVIVVISFLVFVFVIFILVSTFLTTMASAGSAASSAGASASQFMGNVDIFFYTRLFSHAAMIQGIFSGLVAGQMGEGRAIAGLKYSAVMLIIAWVMFRFFV